MEAKCDPFLNGNDADCHFADVFLEISSIYGVSTFEFISMSCMSKAGSTCIQTRSLQ